MSSSGRAVPAVAQQQGELLEYATCGHLVGWEISEQSVADVGAFPAKGKRA